MEQQPVSRDNEPERSVVKIEQTTVAFAGPLPHPAILSQYDKIVPGAAQRILTMAEEQSKHRRDLEKKVIYSDTFNSRWGLLLGFIIGLVAVIGSILIILNGYRVEGFLINIIYIGSLVGIFVYGSRQRRKEREERRISN